MCVEGNVAKDANDAAARTPINTDGSCGDGRLRGEQVLVCVVAKPQKLGAQCSGTHHAPPLAGFT